MSRFNAKQADFSTHLEAVLNTVIDGIITIDRDGIVHSFNPSAERIFGYAASEVIGQNVKMLMPEPYQSKHDTYLHNYHRTGQRQIIGIGREVQGKRKDGTTFPMELGVNEMTTSDSTMFVGTVRDISARKLAQQRQQDSEAKLQAIVDNTVDGLITINERGLVESFNKACERIFGYAASEVIGQNVKMLMPEPYQSKHDTYLHNYHRTGQRQIIGIGREVQGKRKDGTTFPLDLSISEITVNGQRIYSGILRDISERVEAEKRLRLLSSVVQHSNDLIIITDAQDLYAGPFIIFVNDAFETTTGYHRDEIIGKTPRVLQGEGTSRDTLDEIRACLEAGESFSGELLNYTKEQIPYWTALNIFPITDTQGMPMLFASVQRDMTQRRADEAQLRQAHAELEEFAYRTSHDLRSPLVSSIRLLELAKDSIHANQTDRALKSVAHTYDSLKKLEALVKDILLIAQTKHKDEAEEAVDLRVLIREALDKFKHMAHFERLTIAHHHTFSGTLLAKRSRLTLIIENLISNAIKYQDLTRADSFLRIETKQEAQSFLLEVHDNGLGIPPSQQEQLFEMFRRFHPRTSFGSGLGLYMVKKSADILGGQIAFRDPGEGSVFALRIPLTHHKDL